jgi:hypothetical protein
MNGSLTYNTWHIAKCNTSAHRAPMALACPRTKPLWKQNPHNCKLGNHLSLPYIVYGFLVVLKGGGKSVHILEEECLRELIIWF